MTELEMFRLLQAKVEEADDDRTHTCLTMEEAKLEYEVAEARYHARRDVLRVFENAYGPFVEESADV